MNEQSRELWTFEDYQAAIGKLAEHRAEDAAVIQRLAAEVRERYGQEPVVES